MDGDILLMQQAVANAIEVFTGRMNNKHSWHKTPWPDSWSMTKLPNTIDVLVGFIFLLLLVSCTFNTLI